MKHIKLSHLSIASILALGIINTTSFAASSEVFFDNASGLGNAYSGKAAIADDASTTYFNPAGLTKLNHAQFIIGDVQTRFNGTYRGSDVYTIPGVVTIPQTGFVNGQPTYPPYPFLYFSTPINNKVSFGFGVLTPYGIGVSIPDSSIVRYAGTRYIMYVIDLSPAISYKFNEQVSGGFGLDIQRMSFTTVAMSPSLTGGSDSRIRNDASSWAYSWHAGVLYDISPSTRTGLTYHAQSVFHLKGSSSYVIAPGSNVGNEIISNNFRFSTTLAPTTTVSLYHDVNPKVALLGTIDYSEWSNLNKTIYYNIAVPSNTGAPSTTNSLSNQYYNNTWRFAFGTNYKINPKFMLRFGIAVETDPTNSTYRPLTDPGTASTSLAAGFHYQPTKTFGLDMGYQHFFMHDSSIHTIDGLNTENGTVTLQRDALGIQANWDIA